MEQAFKIKLKEDRDMAHLNSACFSKEKYEEIIDKVLKARSKVRNKLPADYKLLKKYDVIKTEGGKKLIVPLKGGESHIIFYVHDEELFRILTAVHVNLEHAGRDKMMRELKKTYKNITYKDIMIFLNLCDVCTRKYKREKKQGDKSALFNEFNSKSQIDLIDYQSYPDGEFKYVMIYQELHTKFSLLKPLKNVDSEEIADNLVDIFTVIGPPLFLQSSHNEDILPSIVCELKKLWNGLQINVLKSEDPPSYLNQDVENMITKWMRDKITSRWSEGLKFIQLKKNTTFHPTINKSPYEALFRRPLKGVTVTTVEEEEEEVSENAVEPEILWKIEPEDEEYENECDEYGVEVIDGHIKEEITDEMMEEYQNGGGNFENACENCGNETNEGRVLCEMCEDNYR